MASEYEVCIKPPRFNSWSFYDLINPKKIVTAEILNPEHRLSAIAFLLEIKIVHSQTFFYP